MKRFICFVYSINVVFVFISCNKNSIQIPIIKLNPVLLESQFRDSGFLYDIRSIYFDNANYLTDYEMNKIFVLNRNLNLLKSFGKGGKGPGELLDDSHLYVNNVAKRTIELFNNGYHIMTINLPYNINCNGDTRFFIKDHLIFNSNPN